MVKHVESGELSLDDCTYISEADFEKVKKRYNPKPNDLVLTCVGTIGRVALVPQDFIFSADRSLALIRLSEKKLLPKFAKELLQSEAIQAQMASKAIGTAQKHLYLKDIRHLMVNIPEVTVQQYILSQLEPIRHMLQATRASIDHAKRINTIFISTILGT